MIEPIELRKARLSRFITELEDLYLGHIVPPHLIGKVRDLHEEALNDLENLEDMDV